MTAKDVCVSRYGNELSSLQLPHFEDPIQVCPSRSDCRTAGLSELTTSWSVAVGVYRQRVIYTFAGEAATATSLMSSKCSTLALPGPDKSLSDVSPRIWILC